MIKAIIKSFFQAIMTLVVIGLLYYVVLDLISIWNRVHVKDEFYIEYEESQSSVSLRNGPQIFMGNISEAYWNSDSLVVSGSKGCFLIEFGKTLYNDEMIEIGCENLNRYLESGSIKSYIRD